MSLRSPLIQIIVLLVGLIIGSFVDRAGLPVALMEVRLPLVLVLVIAVGYLELQLRQSRAARQLVRQESEMPAHERVR